ncbi:MAG: DUF3592 domain-containing protein [Steroidobacteraceae bacterium]|nr:DUF3592 domain-containing protein [Steroidobacteraceae bacterium]
MLHMLNVVSLVGLTMVLLGLYASWQAWYAFASRGWPSVPGRVLLAGVYGFDGAPPAYKAHIRYRYNVNGVTYESTRVRFGGVNPFSYRMTASELVAAGSASGEVHVFYDIHNLKRACLITGPNEWTLPLPILLLLFGTGVLALGIFSGLVVAGEPADAVSHHGSSIRAAEQAI